MSQCAVCGRPVPAGWRYCPGAGALSKCQLAGYRRKAELGRIRRYHPSVPLDIEGIMRAVEAVLRSPAAVWSDVTGRCMDESTWLDLSNFRPLMSERQLRRAVVVYQGANGNGRVALGEMLKLDGRALDFAVAVVRRATARRVSWGTLSMCERKEDR